MFKQVYKYACMEVHFSIISTQVYVGSKLLMNDFYMQTHFALEISSCELAYRLPQ